MYTGLLHTHNLFRYIIVILLLINLLMSFMGWLGKKSYQKQDDKLSLFLFIAAHIQLLLGFGLYFISPIVETAMADFANSMKNDQLRFWGVEHMTAMVLGIILITLGRIMAKKAKTDSGKFRRQAVFFLLATVSIFSAIPWPWSEISRAWF